MEVVLEEFLRTLADLPPLLVYLVIGAGAAIENIIPPIPADTFVLLGAFLTTQGKTNAWMVFFVTWGANVGTATAVYLLARRYGRTMFETKFGRMLLNEKQMKQIGGFYDRFGIFAIFFSRFLPAFRAMVPVFAGVTDKPALRVLPPLALASGLWYGLLIYVGATAGKSFDEIMAFFDRGSSYMLVIAGVLIGAFVFWWVRSRREQS